MHAVPSTATNAAVQSPGNVSEVFALQVGDRIHRVVARTLTGGLSPDREVRTRNVVADTAQVLREYPMAGARGRAAMFEIATAAACYLHRFVLPEPWTFHAAEMTVVSGRVDVVWENTATGEMLIDEVKSTVGRSGEVALRPQIDRYVAAGAALWGERFVGLRLCALSEPRRSRLYPATRKYSFLLADTSLAGGVA